MKHFFRSNPLYGAGAPAVTPQEGVIKNVVLATKGLNKNGTYFSDRFLKQLLEKGNERGYIKARFGHPNMCDTTLGSYIGRYKNFRLQNGKLYGDLYIDPITKQTEVKGRGISMYDYIVQMAQNNHEMFGNSIHISAKFFEETYQENGETKRAEGHDLVEWIASDLVDSPAATENLFFGVEDLGVKITQFLDDTPQIFEVLDKHPEVLAEFLQKYKNYSQNKNKKNMTVFEKIKEMFSAEKKAFDLDLTLADGRIITVATDATEPQEGDAVSVKGGGALEDGEHLTVDKKKLTVKGGVIEKITDSQEEKAPEAPAQTEEKETKNEKEANPQMEALATQLQEATAQFNEVSMFLASELSGLKKQFETLAKGVKSQYQVQDNATEANFARDNQKTDVLTIEDIKARMKQYNQN